MHHRILVLTAALSGLLAGCRADVPHGAPDIVVVLVDGLGADPPGEEHAEAALLEVAGLDRYARFGQAYAQSPAPYLGLHALLTGRYPSAVPICLPSRPGDGEPDAACTQAPADRAMLQEVLTAYGYRAAYFEQIVSARPQVTGGLPLAPEMGPLRGFSAHDLFRVEEWTAGRAPAIHTWWTQNADAPRFLVVQGYLFSEAFLAVCGRDQPVGPRPKDIASLSALRTPEERAAIEAEYREAARLAGRFVATLREDLAPGPGGRILVLGSLYGVNLTHYTGTQPDQLWCGTHAHLLERNLHVPLYVEGLGSSPRKDAIVQLIDLLPTLARAAGAVPPAGALGHDLFDAAPARSWAYAEYGDMLALRERSELLQVRCFEHGASALDPRLTDSVVADLAELRAAPPEEAPRHRCEASLYDVIEDHYQTHDLAGFERALLLERFERLVQVRTGPAAPAALDGARFYPNARRIGYW